MDLQRLTEAMMYCDSLTEKAQINGLIAKKYQQKSKWELAAKTYAVSSVPFESVSLELIDQPKAWAVYLETMLGRAKGVSQKQVLASVLLEVKLDLKENVTEFLRDNKNNLD